MSKFLPTLFHYDKLYFRLPMVRGLHRMLDATPESAQNLKQKLQELNQGDPTLDFKVDIGLPPSVRVRKDEVKERAKVLRERKRDPNIEADSRRLRLVVPLDEIRSNWTETDMPKHIKSIAEHYGIFQDLFGDAYFYPCVYLDIGYPVAKGLEAPVHRGNVVKPKEASSQPRVQFKSEPDDLWTLILTNPDGHLTEVNKEYVHWFVGNIPGGNISKGEVIWDYLQPFPPRGMGFQRFVFVLYKQDKKIDYSKLKKKQPCLELKDRTFETLEFYREQQDYLTPAGLAFFQTDWDLSVQQLYHHTLNMEEPVFEYDHEPQYKAPQKWFPRKASFNQYLDKYRDPRDIYRDYLLKKLKETHPLEHKKPFPYPNIYWIDTDKVPSWLTFEERRRKSGKGRVNELKDDDYTS